MTTVTAMDVWHASQSRKVKVVAWKLWRNKDGVENGIQEAVLLTLNRLDWFDPAKGTLEIQLMYNLKSVRQLERSRGHRRGTTDTPRVFCPGEDEIPVVPDLCDPESILIAKQINLDEVRAQRAKDSAPKSHKLTPDDVRAIRASDTTAVQLARRFKVSPCTIHRVRQGKSYKEAA